MKKLMNCIQSNKRRIISILLTVSMMALGSYNGFTVFAIAKPDNAATYHQVQTFSVASKNTITGEVTTKEYDTATTTAAINRGETVVSTPAFAGTDPGYEDFRPWE